MKKLLIIPVMLLCLSGAPSIKIPERELRDSQLTPALNTKVDSINVKAMELNRLIRE